MRDFFRSRIFRCMICLILVCCLLVMFSPVRAKAVIVELTVAEAIKWGIIAIATLATCGVVYTITSDADLAAIGQTFYNEAHTTYSAAEKLDEFNQMKEVIGKAYNGRTIPFWSPNGNDDIIKALMAASIVGFLNLYDNLQPTEISYADPQYLELSQGLTTRHAYLLGGDVKDVSYEVCSGSAPVFTFRYCTARKHTTVFCSSEYFEVNKHTATTTNYEANAATLSDGSKVYYLFLRTSITGSGGFSSDCVPVSTTYTDSELLEICGGLVANGIPETVLEVPRYVSDLMQANGLLTEDYAIQIPAIDFSSFTSDHEMLDFVAQVASGEKSYQDWLDKVTSGAAPRIIPLPDPDPEPDSTEGTEPTQPILPDPDTGTDPGTGTNPDPGTGTNPDPGTGTDPDPGTGTNPDPGTGTNPDPGTGTNPDVDPNPGTNSGSSSWTPPSDMGKFTLDLKQYFPFCIPFDLYAFFTCLNAEPVAPVIEWIIPLPGGKTYPFEIDLSAFDSVAQILRRMQLLLFCVGLAFKTRDLIKG